MELKNGKNVIKKNGKTKVVTYFDLEVEPSRTHQEFTEECDVNAFIKKQKALNPTEFQKWFNSPTQSGTYADFTELPTYQDMVNTIARADQDFEQLPSNLRQRFQNNPQELINFLSDPKNEEESIQLGLRIKKSPPTPNPIETTLNQIAKNTAPKKPKPTNDED